MPLIKLQADRLFNGYRFVENHVLILRDNDVVEAIVPAHEVGEGVEKIEGLLVPGFINCHCHLELSHLKNTIEPGKGLVNFLMAVIDARKKVFQGKDEAIKAATEELYKNGTAGVADICNTTDALTGKTTGAILWHNLVEVLNLSDETLESRLQHFNTIRVAHRKAGLPAVLAPHAPYSISGATFKAINEATTGAIISIHNQETPAEDVLFKTGSGDFLKLYDMIGYTASPLPVSGKSSLQTWLPNFTNGQTILLVHNTFTGEDDICFAKAHASKYGLTLLYCLCPNANLYVEDSLPPVDLLIKHDCAVVLGTDSLSSNRQLSIWSEIQTIRKYFPHLSLEMILKWATANGANALRWHSLGTFEKGKKPGVILIKEDFSITRLI
jgi:cytosine/adenosine deaminase-related metal-dependent hydrolase